MPSPHPGEWEVIVQDSHVTAIHAHLLPNGKVLYFHARYPSHYATFVSCIFDPVSNLVAEEPIIPVWPGSNQEPSALFCSGHTFLADGKLLVAGGERTRPPVSFRGIRYSFIFDHPTNTWRNTGTIANPSSMGRGRWYPQLTRAHDGRVVAMSGYEFDSQVIEEIPEYYQPTPETWVQYPPAAYKEVPLYNGAHIIPFGPNAGEILYDLVSWGPAWNQAWRFNPDPNAQTFWNTVGQQRSGRAHGNSVMLPINSSVQVARIINLGGGNNTAEMITLDAADSNPQWMDIPSMNFARHDAPNALLLADGSLIVIGGDFTLVPEKLDYSDPNPQNWIWDQLPAMTVPRKYHSTALLLPDGRVWVAGGRIYRGWNEFEDDMERRIEVYKPGYLFEGERPQIVSAPSTIHYQEVFDVQYSGIDIVPKISSVVLIGLGSVTHCFDANQRYVVLDIVGEVTGGIQVVAPANSFIAPPGYYMLFILKDKSQSISGEVNIPSVAKIVKLVEP